MNRINFEFTANKENNTLSIKREFEASQQLVWDCFTTQKLLEQWWAPKPFTIETKSMNFSNSGHWHYAMVDDKGNKYWGLTKYSFIKPIECYETLDAFSNIDGEIITEMPQAKWTVCFSESRNITRVDILIKYETLSDVEKVINMGMQQGLTMTLDQLNQLITNNLK